MGWLNLLMSPSGAPGIRESLKIALKTNIRRADGSPFEKRAKAIAATLVNRYRFTKRPHVELLTALEAAPFAYLDESRVPNVVPEYVVDQELPNETYPWLDDVMSDTLASFFSDKRSDLESAQTSIFIAMSTGHLDYVHWMKWLDEDIIGLIFDRAKEAGVGELLKKWQR